MTISEGAATATLDLASSASPEGDLQILPDGAGGTEIEFLNAPTGAPTITGTVAGQTTTSEAPVRPFAGVAVTDPNAGATETLTIVVSGSGGTLSGAGLASTGLGVYALTGDAATVTGALDALSFTPNPAPPHATATTVFTLIDVSSANATPVVDLLRRSPTRIRPGRSRSPPLNSQPTSMRSTPTRMSRRSR